MAAQTNRDKQLKGLVSITDKGTDSPRLRVLAAEVDLDFARDLIRYMQELVDDAERGLPAVVDMMAVMDRAETAAAAAGQESATMEDYALALYRSGYTGRRT